MVERTREEDRPAGGRVKTKTRGKMTRPVTGRVCKRKEVRKEVEEERGGGSLKKEVIRMKVEKKVMGWMEEKCCEDKEYDEIMRRIVKIILRVLRRE